MSHKYTFDIEKRYLTKGISETVPFEIQLFIWSEIDKLVSKSEQTDYLQVFEFKVHDNYMEMEHRSEDPEYKNTHRIKLLKNYQVLNNVKIFVIDDIDHSTMLLAEEY